MQDYVQTLIEATKSVEGYQYTCEKIRTKDILDDIQRQASGLAEAYHLKINWEEQYMSEAVSVAYDQIVRAFMNVIKNAAEHTPEGGTIYISIKEQVLKI